MVKTRKTTRRKRRYRIRKRLSGTLERPRVAVYRSLNHIYLQAFDDISGTTLLNASSQEKDIQKKIKKVGGNVAAAEAVGELMATKLKKKGLESIVFDRGGFIYHGRVKAAAEAMRKGGIKF